MASSICLQFYEVFKVGVNGKPGLEELAKSQKWLESGILNTSGKKRWAEWTQTWVAATWLMEGLEMTADEAVDWLDLVMVKKASAGG